MGRRLFSAARRRARGVSLPRPRPRRPGASFVRGGRVASLGNSGREPFLGRHTAATHAASRHIGRSPPPRRARDSPEHLLSKHGRRLRLRGSSQPARRPGVARLWLVLHRRVSVRQLQPASQSAPTELRATSGRPLQETLKCDDTRVFLTTWRGVRRLQSLPLIWATSRPPARSWEEEASGLCLGKSGLKTTNSLSVRVQTPKPDRG